MTHIVNVAFDFDDEKVKSVAESTVENEMGKIVKDIVLDRIAPMEKTWYMGRLERNWEKFDNRVSDITKDFLDAERERIIELAATKLADSVKRTKVWKERFQNTLEEGVES